MATGVTAERSARLEGSPVALVTGSTRGIGRAVAWRLAKDGLRVVINHAHDEIAARAALEALRRDHPDAEPILIRADVTDPSAAAGLVEGVIERMGRLDVLVTGVGPMVERSASETTPEEWRAMMAGNADSAFFVISAALPTLRERGGAIVTIGSLNAELARGADQHAAYNAAKAALVVLTRSLARSEGEHGVRVNMVSPGIIETESTPKDVIRAMPSRIPLGRLGRPDEVADAVAYLVSPRASYISGAVLTVAGGLWV